MRLSQASAFLLFWRSSYAATNSETEATILRHHAELEARFAESPVQGVRKMSDDEGEKFFLEYWQFAGDSEGAAAIVSSGEIQSRSIFEFDGRESDDRTDFSPAQFLTRSYPFSPALPGLDEGSNVTRRYGILLRNSLFGRDFECPTGTNPCLSINRSDRCCATGDTCQVIKETGHGTVGCCPKGQTCGGGVGSCQSGYTACSKALGGGCCIPGYECVEGGCAYTSVVTVTIDHTITTSTITYSTRPQTTHSVGTTETTSTSKSFESTETTSTDKLTQPARPTSLHTTQGTTTMTGGGSNMCPTGFYACSAVYHGGCCQTGRDCDTTSCPTTRSTTLTSNGKTIVVPVTTGGSDTGSGRCAIGWFSCADTAGGGCCPRGYACGSSCTATAATATTTVKKERPTSSGGRKLATAQFLLPVSAVVMICILSM